jgi:hypothetical protein
LYYSDLENLCSKHHDIENLFRNLVSFGLVQLQQKFDDVYFLTALQCYQTLMVTHPTFIQRVPPGIIARLYFLLIKPLHKIIAPVMLKSIIQLTTNNDDKTRYSS